MQRSHRLRCIVSNFVVYASKKEDIPFGVSSFLLALRADANLLNATVRWTVARDGLTERNHNFRQRRKCKSSPVTVSVLRVPQQDTRHHLTDPERVILGRFFLTQRSVMVS